MEVAVRHPYPAPVSAKAHILLVLDIAYAETLYAISEHLSIFLLRTADRSFFKNTESKSGIL